MKKILVVDDDVELSNNLSDVLETEGYESFTASSGEEALEKVSASEFDIVLLDLIMPGIKGLDILPELIKLSPKTKVIMITAFSTIDSAIEAIKKGASEYVSKPFDVEELLTIISRVLEEVRIERKLNNLNMDNVMGSLANSIRRKTIKFIHLKKKARFMEILKEAGLEDNAKMAFHLRTLKESEIIKQDSEKFYSLTKEGE